MCHTRYLSSNPIRFSLDVRQILQQISSQMHHQMPRQINRHLSSYPIIFSLDDPYVPQQMSSQIPNQLPARFLTKCLSGRPIRFSLNVRQIPQYMPSQIPHQKRHTITYQMSDLTPYQIPHIYLSRLPAIDLIRYSAR